jgi:ribosomal protein S18 acetylase RimI-like enzyme
MTHDDFDITEAATTADWAAARELFEEYAAGLGVDLCFQNFAHELATLPGAYAAPDGCILLARRAPATEEGRADAVGCVALRKIGEGVCEMKRLYLRPEFHGRGVGRALAVAVIEAARDRGYRAMRLDTLGEMKAALTLYRSLGFVEREAYYNNPTPHTVYLELDLTR